GRHDHEAAREGRQAPPERKASAVTCGYACKCGHSYRACVERSMVKHKHRHNNTTTITMKNRGWASVVKGSTKNTSWAFPIQEKFRALVINAFQ
ncbi:unnamed protein product, partial [Amoebophrya sp. A25]